MRAVTEARPGSRTAPCRPRQSGESEDRPTVVWKFGGTSVADLDRVRAVARRMVDAQGGGRRVVGRALGALDAAGVVPRFVSTTVGRLTVHVPTSAVHESVRLLHRVLVPVPGRGSVTGLRAVAGRGRRGDVA